MFFFLPSTLNFTTNKTDRHGIAEILIDYCVTSNEQYISYIQAEDQFNSI